MRAQPVTDEWAPETGSGVRAVLRSGYTRVRYVLETRSTVLEMRPAPASDEGPLAPLPDTGAIDAYDPAAHTIPERTLVVCACPACAQPGYACDVCLGSGRIDAWITVRSVRHSQVVVHGAGPARDRHEAVALAEDFDRGDWPNQLVHQAWYRSVPAQLAHALHPRLNPRTDRVQWAHVQVFVG